MCRLSCRRLDQLPSTRVFALAFPPLWHLNGGRNSNVPHHIHRRAEDRRSNPQDCRVSRGSRGAHSRPRARSHVHIGLLQGEGGLLISTSKKPSEDALSHRGSGFGIGMMQEGVLRGPRDSERRWLMVATEWKGAFHDHIPSRSRSRGVRARRAYHLIIPKLTTGAWGHADVRSRWRRCRSHHDYYGDFVLLGGTSRPHSEYPQFAPRPKCR
ncbi:hypothetical protein EI94DRAFT_1749727 [Lactarius quietus]|nr:hypothetical protein EI94DRAFT_1749727 [Lactarius quietus]